MAKSQTLVDVSTLRSERAEIDDQIAILTAKRIEFEEKFDESLGDAFDRIKDIFQSVIGSKAKPKGKRVKSTSEAE